LRVVVTGLIAAAATDEVTVAVVELDELVFLEVAPTPRIGSTGFAIAGFAIAREEKRRLASIQRRAMIG
jgi:hypothetical protein